MSNKISVIITAHDRKKYILEALSSVINNNLPKDKLEIII
ncbi:glycosyltransferase [Saccharolobus islandicus]